MCKLIDINIMSQIIATPIAKNHNPKHDSKRDYKELQQRKKQNIEIYWDSVPPNKEKFVKNPLYLCFIFNDIKVVIYKILDVQPIENRLSSLQSNVGHSNRKVLHLSQESFTITWADYLNLNGIKKCMGTTHLKKGEKELLQFIEKNEMF